MLYAQGWNWRKRLTPHVPQETTGGPGDDDAALAEQNRRLGFIERRLDWLTRRVNRLEKTVAADAIAPLDPPPGNRPGR